MSGIVLKVTKNKDGRAIVNLYGREIDITEMGDENGKGSFKQFGKVYDFRIVEPETKKTKAQTKSKKTKKGIVNE